MTIAAFAVALSMMSGPDNTGALDPSSLISMIDSLQSNIKDFNCEYEGTIYFRNPEVIAQRKLDPETGLDETFQGIFIHKYNGDTRSDSLHRSESTGLIFLRLLVIRAEDNEAEQYIRTVDVPIDDSLIADPALVNADASGCLGRIFLLETIKRLAAREELEMTVEDDSLDGRDLKLLSVSFKGRDQLYQRLWIDLSRGGHAVRRESYAPDGSLVGRTDITLASFPVGGEEVWMPVSAVGEGHAAIKDGKVIHPKEPTSIEKMNIVNGTLEFNQRPGPETFTVKYKPGTRVTDNLRRLQYEFGQQKTPRVSKREVEAQLHEQLAKADDQSKELVASSPARDGPGWTSWLTWLFGAITIVLAGLVVLQRRHR